MRGNVTLKYVWQNKNITVKSQINNKIKIDNNTLFACLYFLYLIKNFMFYGTTIIESVGNTTSKGITLTLHMLIFFLSVWIIFFKYKITKKKMIEFFVMMGIGGIIAIKTGSTSFIDFILIIFCARKIDFDYILRRILSMQTYMTLFIVGLAFFHIIEMIIDTTNKSMGKRYAMGFTHPNRVAIISFEIICLILYCYKEKSKWKYIISLAISLLIFSIAKSRTAFLLSLLIIIMIFTYEVVIEKIKIHNVKFLVRMGIVLACIATFVFIWYLYKNQKLYYESTLISRIRMAIIYYGAYPVNLFGNRITSGTSTRLPGTDLGYYFLDNAPLEYLLKNGILAFSYFVGIYCLSIGKLIKNRCWKLLMILICYAIYAMVETNPFSLVCNVFLLVFGYIQNKNERIKLLK